MVRATVVPTTPIIQTRRQKVSNGAITSGADLMSPPTPHRIELRDSDGEGGGGGNQRPIDVQLKTTVGGAKKDVGGAPPKARRRLNNNLVIEKNQDNHKLTDFFPVRRSVRKTKTIMLEEKQMALEKAVRNCIEDGLEVRWFDNKGRGVVAARDFCRGEFVVEYSGDLVDTIEAKQREEKYAQNENTGCYMYYFKHNGQQYCIDATAETGRLGRLVNHSRNGNLLTKTIMIDNKPRLVLIAKDDIKKGEEVLYDYGDRSKESLKHHPWLAN